MENFKVGDYYLTAGNTLGLIANSILKITSTDKQSIDYEYIYYASSCSYSNFKIKGWKKIESFKKEPIKKITYSKCLEILFK